MLYSKNNITTPLCELLGCKYPILQAGMGGVARSDLVAAVSIAGGFGCLGMVREKPTLIHNEIKAVQNQTDKPFGVNLIPSGTKPELFNAELDVCIKAKVQTMVYFWDVVPAAIKRAKDAGMTVIYQVGSVEDAIAAEKSGADAIIVQGLEAGGHVKGNVSSLVLVPKVVQSVNIPVIGSGGFSDGASLIAALALGAQGIHCGTAFLATKESFAHKIHKQKIIKAGVADTVHTDAFAINWPKNSPVRVIANEMTDSLGTQLFGYDPSKMDREEIANEDGRPIYKWSTDSPLRNMTGDLESLAHYYGQVAGLINQIETTESLISKIITQAENVLQKLPKV